MTSESFEYLKTLASDVHVVRGDLDDTDTQSISWPEQKVSGAANSNSNNLPNMVQTVNKTLQVVTVGQFRIGICHGHQLVPWGDPDCKKKETA